MVVLPDDRRCRGVAAAMNPAMSSWVALRRRVPLEAGQDVLILGVTGNAGQMAVQIAKRAGRPPGNRLRGEIRSVCARSWSSAPIKRWCFRTTRGSPLPRSPRQPVSGSRPRLSLGKARRRSDRRSPDEARGSQSGAQLGPNRVSRRPDDPAPLRRAPLGELPVARERSGQCLPRAYLAELPSLIDRLTANRLKVSTATASLQETSRPRGTGQRRRGSGWSSFRATNNEVRPRRGPRGYDVGPLPCFREEAVHRGLARSRGQNAANWVLNSRTGLHRKRRQDGLPLDPRSPAVRAHVHYAIVINQALAEGALAFQEATPMSLRLRRFDPTPDGIEFHSVPE